MFKIGRILVKLFISLIVIAVVFVGVLTIFEYRPEPIEDVDIQHNPSTIVELNTSMRIMTFNMGYAGLGKDEDFVMDGGQKGRPDSLEVVESYFDGIISIVEEYSVDFYVFQEVDLNSRRSYNMNQYEAIIDVLGSSYNAQFAYNFKALFVPFPLSLTDYIGSVESGISTFSQFETETSERHQFPGAFSWPLRVANLKRAMLVSHYEIEGSSQQLVVVNLHMSAYDGDGTLRAQEMAYLKDFMTEQYTLGNYVIVGGDFNQTFPDAVDIYDVNQDFYVAYPIEDDFLPVGYSFQVDLSNPTCRLLNQPYNPNDLVNTQYYIIDGFIVSDNISIEKYMDTQQQAQAMTINHAFLYSDHNPVVMQFRLLP